MHSVTKIISGAQIGADIAGLKAAKLLGLETGGYVLKNCKTLDGNKPEWITLYGLTELASVSYPERTALNVKHSDGTVRFAYDFNSRGELCTLRNIKLWDKPYFDVPVILGTDLFIYKRGFLEWLMASDIHTLNVAGNAYPVIEPQVVNFLLESLATPTG
jgi:hypothetical protein